MTMMRKRNLASMAMLAALAAIALAPLWFLGTGSLMKASKMMVMPPKLLPRNPTLENYRWAFRRDGLMVWAGNTVLVVVAVAVGSTAVSAMGGYAFAVYRFKGKRALWAFLLLGIMVPRIALIIPLFVVMRKMGINGTIWTVILPCLFSPAGLFLARGYFEQVPRSLIESARIDGASEAQVLWHVVAPVSKPIVASLALFSAIGALQDWIWQALNLQEYKAQTLMVGWIRATMARSVGDNDVNPMGHSMAVAVLLLIPLVLVFIAAKRYFVESISGSIKE